VNDCVWSACVSTPILEYIPLVCALYVCVRLCVLVCVCIVCTHIVTYLLIYGQFWSEISLIRLCHPRTYWKLANLPFLILSMGDDAVCKFHDLSKASYQAAHVFILMLVIGTLLSHCVHMPKAM
jgi:hypothetical protein